MYILGFCAYVFDSSACLIKDGEIIAAAQEERFTRVKNTGDFPLHAIKFCLSHANISIEEVDHVTFYWQPFVGLTDRILQIIKGIPHTLNFWDSHSDKWMDMVKAKKTLKEHFPGKHKFEFHNIRHHNAHAASTYFVSPFKEANLIVMDGSGEIECTSLGTAQENKINLYKKLKFPHSLGYLYVALTHYLGFKPDSDEYKVMAMASMGEESHYYDLFKKIITLTNDGLYKFDLSYFNFQKGIRNPWVSKKFIAEFGPLRIREPNSLVNTGPLEKRHYDIAFALQKRLEDVAIHMATKLYEESPHPHLLLSGGVALNCVMNEVLRKNTPYENVWTISAPHDAGTSLGGALYFYHQTLSNPRSYTYKTSALGPEFTDDEIEKAFQGLGEEVLAQLKIQKLPHEDLCDVASERLLKGEIVGWFQGRTEFGPRALGSRSILADPRSEEMKNKINAKIKHREAFRPFAPAILKEKAHLFFKIEKEREIPFMTHVVQARQDKKEKIAAVVHFDGTSRVQTVDKKVSPLFYQLIQSFEDKTSIPALLNTSFNDNGEPIVNSPEDAFKSFQSTNLDCLFIGNYYVEKQKNF